MDENTYILLILDKPIFNLLLGICNTHDTYITKNETKPIT